MSGLEQRLRSLEGVADITVELGEDGLEGIRITVSDGSDETAVLDDVRRLLITYGLKSRRVSSDRPLLPEFAPSPEEGTESTSVRQPTATGSAARTPDPPEAGTETLAREWTKGDAPSEIRMVKTPEGLQVRLGGLGREIVEDGSGTPEGAATAMARAVSRWRGLDPPERVIVKIEEIEGEQVITMTVATGERIGAGAAVGRPSMTAGLFRAADSALGRHPDPRR